MGILDSKTGKEFKLSEKELVAAACEMRAAALTAIHAAGSGHPGGSFSAMDIAAALFLNEARLDPRNPGWDGRDRIIFSTGHKAPVLYAALAKAGFFKYEDMVTLRKIYSPFQGHPHKLKLKGVEVSTGSLGQGLGIACGEALSAKMDGKDFRVYCIMGDGEQQEGSVWEAAMAAGHHKLDNLVAIVDKNNLQIDGNVKDVMDVDPLGDKYRAFNWHVLEIDGHDMGEILKAFARARENKGRPTCIIARTVKGKGVKFMENIAGWHGVATKNDEQFAQALSDINCPSLDKKKIDSLLNAAKKHQAHQEERLKTLLPKFAKNYWWNKADNMKADMEPTRFGFGKCLKKYGGDRRIVTLHADISDSIKISDFEKENPERKNRVISVGIAEQNMMSVAAGLALNGKIPVAGTYGVFASGRAWDQIRTTICYDNLNVKIAGAHGGISVGQDGATHQAVEEIALMNVLPNMNLILPCDSLETERLSRAAILDINGPCYIRFAREATPVVTKESTPCVFGKANVIRYRKAAARFADAFETVPACEYNSEKENLCLIACGTMVPEAMRAAYILKEEIGAQTRVLAIHTVKPIDREAILKAALETGAVITCEEHQEGGFGNIVAAVIASGKGCSQDFVFDMVGINDRFGESGGPWELMVEFGLSAEFIAEKAITLLKKKKRK
jgi:transketolase